MIRLIRCPTTSRPHPPSLLSRHSNEQDIRHPPLSPRHNDKQNSPPWHAFLSISPTPFPTYPACFAYTGSQCQPHPFSTQTVSPPCPQALSTPSPSLPVFSPSIVLPTAVAHPSADCLPFEYESRRHRSWSRHRLDSRFRNKELISMNTHSIEF